MKIPRVQRKGSEGTNPGFKAQDQYALDQVNNHIPRTQMFTRESNEEMESPSLCAECGSTLTYFSSTDKFVCNYVRCGKVISNVATTPLTKTNQSMQPYRSQHFDPNNDDDEIFFVSFGPDSQQADERKDYEITYDTGRVKHIKCKGFPTDISIDAFND